MKLWRTEKCGVRFKVRAVSKAQAMWLLRQEYGVRADYVEEVKEIPQDAYRHAKSMGIGS